MLVVRIEGVHISAPAAFPSALKVCSQEFLVQTGMFRIVVGVEMGAAAQDTLAMLSKDFNKDTPGSCTRACFLLWHLLREQPGAPQTTCRVWHGAL